MDRNKIDILKEISSIGTSHAASALSQMLGCKVMIEVPSVQLLPLSEVANNLGGPEKPIIGLHFQILGDLNGRIMLILDRKSGHKIAAMLVGDNPSDESRLENLDESAIKELGNIVTNSYLNAIAELLGVKLMLSVPFYAEDMMGAVIDLLLIEISQIANHAILLETKITAEASNLSGSFIIFPDEKFLEELFAKTDFIADDK